MTNQEYKLTDSFELQSQVRTGNSNSDTIRVIHKPIKSADSLVIVLHGYTMKKECLLYIGDFLNSIGISTAHIDLPLHGERAFDGAEHCYPRDVSPEKIKRGIEQIYSEVNQLSSLFRSRYHSIGLFGFSLGAISTMLCMGRGRQIDKGVAICGGGNLADIILTSPITWDLAQELRNQKVGYKTLRKALKQVEPCNYADNTPQSSLLMINGKFDNIVPPKNTQKFIDSLKKPQKIVWLDQEHYIPPLSEIAEGLKEHFNEWIK